ncbi:hypothetical protein [Actinomadura chokoriensis]|uniref:hypothetical protein n=1 Tax=Actinomadura chokoriensis TaxID=454156 RepID=UPI0031F86A86
MSIILEHAGLLSDAANDRLSQHATDGLAIGTWRAQLALGEPAPLSPEPRTDGLPGDVFALLPRDHEV